MGLNVGCKCFEGYVRSRRAVNCGSVVPPFTSVKYGDRHQKTTITRAYGLRNEFGSGRET